MKISEYRFSVSSLLLRVSYGQILVQNCRLKWLSSVRRFCFVRMVLFFSLVSAPR